MTVFEKLALLNGEKGKSYWAGRVLAQMGYAARVSALNGNILDDCIRDAAAALLAARKEEGVITDAAAKAAENLLLPASSACKALTAHCISHAHIDMNWMWGYQETVGLTIDTFRTVLNLMEEYEGLTFAQSQASVYKILEDHAPEMLEEIKKRVAEGRWEVTAATWVETDKNMPSGEALARHLLNTKTYIRKLFNLPPEKMQLDFEPDTFGHSARVPEICNAGGIGFYYHCRGHGKYSVYRWEGESGASLLVYCEPDWYNAEIQADMFEQFPAFAAQYGLTDVLKVYGVGDHGGGPTRRDIERILDMMTWPVFPTLRFSTYHAFFERLARQAESFPVVKGEQNFIFTGCYTTQSRIKMANRVGEDRLFEAEALAAASKVLGGANRAQRLTAAWEPILFNQFHDILPGSGTIETREYAMGQFQRALADANTVADEAMRFLAANIDTSALPADEHGPAVSEGAGVGFALDQQSGFAFPQTERGRGKTRIFTLFNTTPYDRSGPVEITVWDWPGDPARLTMETAEGEGLPVQILKQGQHFWAHNYTTLLVDAFVPAFGYQTLILKEAPAQMPEFSVLDHGRTHNHWDMPKVLENEHVRAEFDAFTMQLVSLTDKKTGQEIIRKPSCYFRRITESPQRGMTSWIVGTYMQSKNLNEAGPVRILHESGGLCPSVTYQIPFDRSSLTVSVSLPAKSPLLSFRIEVDWQETGNREQGIPQLQFAVPFDFAQNGFLCDVPMGVVVRPAMPNDVPCRSFSAALPQEGETALQVVTDSKYGFRHGEEETAVTLIRAAFDPDPYPEYGKHTIRLGVGASGAKAGDLKKNAALFLHPVRFAGNSAHKGTLPLSAGLFQISGENVAVSAMKTPENGKKGVVLRLYNLSNTATTAEVSCALPILAGFSTDILEEKDQALPVVSGKVTVSLPPCGLQTVRIETA